MLGEGPDHLVHGCGKLLGHGGVGQTPEIGGKYPAPVDAHLPCAGLVCEEDDVVVGFINSPEQAKEEVEGLPCRALLPGIDRAKALTQEPVELGNERVGTPRIGNSTAIPEVSPHP